MITKNQIKYITSLQLKKNRLKEGVFIVEGEKCVAELLRSSFEVVQLFAIKEWINLNTAVTKKIVQISQKELERISVLKSPNKVLAIAIMKDSDFTTINTLNNDWIVMLDNVQDPGNLGTIIRLCDWFGVKHIICSNTSVDMYNPKVVQATMGSIFRMKIYYTTLVSVLTKLPKNTNVFGTYMGGYSLKSVAKNTKGVLLFGNESSGISDELSPFISQKIGIENGGSNTESLNVATATAIVLHHFCI